MAVVRICILFLCYSSLNFEVSCKTLHRESSIHRISIADPFRSISLLPYQRLFTDAVLLVRGETDIFDFEQMETLRVPFYHITHTQIQSEILIYTRLKNLNGSRTRCKSIRHQVVLHGIDQHWRPIKSIANLENEQSTVLSIYPQTVLIIKTSSQTWVNYLGYLGGIFEIYSITGRSMLFAMEYDRVLEKPKVGYVICVLCRWLSTMEKFPSTAGQKWVKRYLALGFRLSRNITMADTILNARANITEMGRNIIWQLPREIQLKHKAMEIINGNEHGDLQQSKHPRAHILGQKKLRLAIINILFPIRNYPSDVQNTQGLIKHCVACNKKSSTQVQQGTNENMCCVNRGIRYSPSSDYNYPVVSFLRTTLRDHDIIYITSENVRSSKNYSAAEIFLTVFDFKIWILLCSLITFSSVLCVSFNYMNGQFRDCLDEGSRHFCSAILEMCHICSFLCKLMINQSSGQHPGSKWLHYKIHFIPAFLFWAPWVAGYLILTNWYTAFMKSSLTFPFPYVLDAKGWRDFENFSLYVILEKLIKYDRCLESVHGYWDDKCSRKMLIWDVNNFQSDSADTCWPNPFPDLYIPPHSIGMSSKFYFDVSSALTDFELVNIEEDYSTHSIFQWFKIIWARTVSCLKHLAADRGFTTNTSNCPERGVILQKMQYRLDAVPYDDLRMYVGKPYQNLTTTARIIGRRMATELKDKILSKDSKYCSKNEKLNYTTDHDDLCRIGNTFYWMTRRSEAAFLTTLTDFPWHWNLFKKLMKEEKSLKFAHTGPKNSDRQFMGQGLGGNGFESPLQVKGPINEGLPEMKWMMRRIGSLAHSGILGFLAKWDQILYPPTDDLQNQFVEDTAAGYQVLTMDHESVAATFTIFMWLGAFCIAMFMAELSFRAFVY